MTLIELRSDNAAGGVRAYKPWPLRCSVCGEIQEMKISDCVMDRGETRR